MAVQNIIQVLKTRLDDQVLNDLYAQQNQQNVHFVRLDKSIMRDTMRTMCNIANSALRTTGGLTSLTVRRANNPVDMRDFDTVYDSEWPRFFTKNRITKLLRTNGFKVVSATSKTRFRKPSVVVTVRSNSVMIELPTPQSRAMQGQDPTVPIPSVLDPVTKRGFLDDMHREFTIQLMRRYSNLRTRKTARTTSLMDSSGNRLSMTRFRTGANNINRAMQQHARKMHGGDSAMHEATTARFVDLVEYMKSPDFKADVMKAGPMAYDRGVNYVLNSFDINYSINQSTISNIVQNRKDIEIMVTIGDTTRNHPNTGLMRDADKPGLENFLDSIEDIVAEANLSPDFKTSPSMTTLHGRQVAKILIKEFLGITHKANPNLKFKVNKRLLAEAKDLKISEKGKFKTSRRKKVGTTLLGAARPLKGTVRGKKAIGKTGSPQDNALRLKNILNSVLPQQVAMKMQSPFLRFRTGRLANSAEVVNVNVGPRGGVGVDYTYMRDPYETFEPGNKQGSTLRDPRRLIGGTIREIMAQQAIGRFNLRRV